MFFFDDNNFVLRAGDPLGERLGQVAREQGHAAHDVRPVRDRARPGQGRAGRLPTTGTVEGVTVGCFPDLYAALAGNPPDQVITL